MLTCDDHWSTQVLEVLNRVVFGFSLQISEICTPQIQHHDWFLWFVFPVAVSSPFYHSHSYLCFSVQLLLAFVVGISITKMHANPRYLNGNGMKTRPPSIPKHPAQVQWPSGSLLQLFIYMLIDKMSEWDEATCEGRSCRGPWHDYLHSKLVITTHFYFLWIRTNNNVCVDTLDKQREEEGERLDLEKKTQTVSITLYFRSSVPLRWLKNPFWHSSMSLTSKKGVRCTAVSACVVQQMSN